MTNVIAEAFATIRPDISGFKGELESGLARVTAEGDASSKSIGGLSHVLGDAKTEIGNLASTAATQLSPALGGAVSSIGSVTGSVTGASSALVGFGLGTVAAGAAIGDMALHGVKDFVSLADSVRTVKSVTGATAEDASKLNAIFDATGVSADTGAQGLFRLSQNIAKHQSTLEADGIVVARSKDGQVDLSATLANVAGAYQQAGAGAAGNKVLFDAFGRSGLSLLPIMRQNTDQLEQFAKAAEEHHQILTDDDLQKAREYQIATHDLSESVSGLERELGGKAIPVLTDFTTVLTNLVDRTDASSHSSHGASSAFGELGLIVGGVEKGLHELAGATDQSKDSQASLNTVVNYGSIAADDYHHKLTDVAISSDDATDATKKYKDALSASYDALLGLRGAYRDEADAVASLAMVTEDGRRKDETAAQYKERLNRSLDDVLRTLPGVVDGMVKQGTVTDTVTGRTNALVSMLQQLKGRYPALAGEIDTFIVSAFNAASQTYPLGVQTAQQYLKGLQDGLVEHGTMVTGSADSLAHNIENTIDYRLGIGGGNIAPAPSATGYGIGKDVGSSIGKGLDDSKKDVALSADQIGEMIGQHIRDSIAGGVSAHQAVQVQADARQASADADKQLADLLQEKQYLPGGLAEAQHRLADLQAQQRSYPTGQFATLDKEVADEQALVDRLIAQSQTIDQRVADARRKADDAAVSLIDANQRVSEAGQQLVSLGPGAPGELQNALTQQGTPAAVVAEILNEVRYLIASVRPITVVAPDPVSAGRAVALAIRTS